jgi:outer membrane protein assembly factor BamD (BamD/ComL family)
MDLSQEVAALESSRAALRAGNAILALRQLDGYSAAFPHGVLEPESILLRIEAQIARGDRAAAAALGRRFLIAFPRSPLAPRVRALVGP